MQKELENLLTAFNRSTWARALLPLLLTALFYLLRPELLADFAANVSHLAKSGSGGFLISGLPYREVISHMPLLDVLVSAFYDSGLGASALAALLYAGLPALVFAAGALAGGYRAGLAALIGAGLSVRTALYLGPEQVLYSLFLLLTLCFILLARRYDSLRNALFCAFSIGASLLLRSPLFMFPPVLLLARYLSRGERVFSWKRAALFLAASYVLLAPWALLNRALTGEGQFLDARRAGTNLITTALGSVYTMEGDPALLADLRKGETPSGFLLRKVKEDPVFYAVTALRRLWHIFLLHPLLLTLFLAALLLGREKDASVFILPVYFILIHSMLSMEERYLVPLIYILPPIIAGSFAGEPRAGDQGAAALAAKTAAAAFVLSFAAVLCLELLMTVYPLRAAANKVENGAIARLSARFPRDMALHQQKCLELRAKGDYTAFYPCLADHDRRFGDSLGRYLLAAMAARTSGAIPAPPAVEARARMDFLIVKTLRELELGDRAAAKSTLQAALKAYHQSSSMLRGTPYRKDRELAAFLAREDSFFYDLYAARQLAMWPPERAARLRAELRSAAGLAPDRRGRGRTDGNAKEERTQELRLFYANFHLKDGAAPPPAPAPAPIPAGKKKAPAPLPADLHSPKALTALCYTEAGSGDRGRALSACQELVALAAAGGARGSEFTEFDAALQSCRLLKAMGRGDEAHEALLWTAATAPAGWPRLQEARRLLEETAPCVQ